MVGKNPLKKLKNIFYIDVLNKFSYYNNFKFFYFIFLFLIILFNFLSYFNLCLYSEDSWSFYDLSKNIITDFYKTRITRQFIIKSDYSISFPPLYPSLIFISNKLFNLGIYTQYLLNFFLLVLCLLVIHVITQKLKYNFLNKAIILLLFLANKEIIEETVAGRSSILSVFLYLLIILILLKNNKLNYSNTIIIGILNGLLSLNRFDSLINSFSLPLILLFLKKINIKKIILLYFSTLIIISPWMIYSYVKFNKFFISDNIRTIISADKLYVLDYNNNPKFNNLFNRTGKWILTRTSYVSSLITLILQNKLLVFIFIFYFFSYLLKKIFPPDNKHELIKNNRIETFIFYISICFSFLSLIPSILTGYIERRYLIFFNISIQFYFMHNIFVLFKNIKKIKKNLLFSSILLILIIFSLKPFKFKIKNLLKFSNGKKYWNNLIYYNFPDLLENIDLVKKEKIFFDKSLKDFFFFASYYDISIILPPSNLNRCNLNKIFYLYKPKFLYFTCIKTLRAIEQNIKLKKISNNLYYVYDLNNNQKKETIICSDFKDKDILCK